MPRLTIALDITASASTPGTRKSSGCASVVFTASTWLKNTSTPSGIASVTSRLSARRTVSSSSMRVWATSARDLMGTGSRATLAGEAQEHVFERPGAGPQLAQEHAAVTQPLGEQRDHRRRGGHVDDVVAGPTLVHVFGRHAERAGEADEVEAGRGAEAGLVGTRTVHELGR